MTALACGGVRKTYGAFVALNDVSLTVDGGEILGLAGPNGAGKTTLFDVLSGRTRPDSGAVKLSGRAITSMSTHRRARLGLARTFQSPIVPTSLTVGETLRSARDAYSPSVDAGRRRTCARARRLRGARRRAGRRPRHARAAQAAAGLPAQRAHGVLLMDEPCSGLLADEIDEIDAIIRRIVAERGWRSSSSSTVSSCSSRWPSA